MLFFVAHQKKGFVRIVNDGEFFFTVSVRMAHPFHSFDEADKFAKENKLGSWAILSNCIG